MNNTTTTHHINIQSGKKKIKSRRKCNKAELLVMITVGSLVLLALISIKAHKETSTSTYTTWNHEFQVSWRNSHGGSKIRHLLKNRTRRRLGRNRSFWMTPEMMGNDIHCMSTRQGPLLITDNVGRVCQLSDVNEGSCCPPKMTIDYLSCFSCRPDIQCCEILEYCVSCCLSKHKEKLPATREQFDECMHLCRTSSRSIKHGNRYKHQFKHCYSFSPNDDLDGGHAHINDKSKVNNNGKYINIDKKISVIIKGKVGQDCQSACHQTSTSVLALSQEKYLDEQPLVCLEEYIPKINDCETLKKYFPCEKGCRASTGSDQPCYVPDRKSVV